MPNKPQLTLIKLKKQEKNFHDDNAKKTPSRFLKANLTRK